MCVCACVSKTKSLETTFEVSDVPVGVNKATISLYRNIYFTWCPIYLGYTSAKYATSLKEPPTSVGFIVFYSFLSYTKYSEKIFIEIENKVRTRFKKIMV